MRYFFSVLCTFALVPLSVFSASFSDVSSSHLFYHEIETVKSKGIVSGYLDGTFKPQATINRAEFTKIIISSLYSQDIVSSCNVHQYTFPDVQSSDWFDPYVCFAKQEGIIEGYPDGYFRPENNITLAEAMKIILDANKVDLSNYGLEYYGAKEWWFPYQDYFDHHFWIKNEINKYNHFKMTTPEYRASSKVNRGEMAYFIESFLSESSEVE